IPDDRGGLRPQAHPSMTQARGLACLMLALLLASGCTTSTTVRGHPERSPATKPDMKDYVMDGYAGVHQSDQAIPFAQVPSSRQRAAEHLYEACLTARRCDVKHQ